MLMINFATVMCKFPAIQERKHLSFESFLTSISDVKYGVGSPTVMSAFCTMIRAGLLGEWDSELKTHDYLGKIFPFTQLLSLGDKHIPLEMLSYAAWGNYAPAEEVAFAVRLYILDRLIETVPLKAGPWRKARNFMSAHRNPLPMEMCIGYLRGMPSLGTIVDNLLVNTSLERVLTWIEQQREGAEMFADISATLRDDVNEKLAQWAEEYTEEWSYTNAADYVSRTWLDRVFSLKSYRWIVGGE